jgi:hypothetical protein
MMGDDVTSQEFLKEGVAAVLFQRAQGSPSRPRHAQPVAVHFSTSNAAKPSVLYLHEQRCEPAYQHW